jgi:hypothetical protein
MREGERGGSEDGEGKGPGRSVHCARDSGASCWSSCGCGFNLASVVRRELRLGARSGRPGSSVGVEDGSLGGGGSSYSSHQEKSSFGRAHEKGALDG